MQSLFDKGPSGVWLLLTNPPIAGRTVTCLPLEFPFNSNDTRYIYVALQDFDECMKVIQEQLDKCNGAAEYPIYVKALIKRQQGTCLVLGLKNCLFVF